MSPSAEGITVQSGRLGAVTTFQRMRMESRHRYKPAGIQSQAQGQVIERRLCSYSLHAFQGFIV